MQPDRVDVQHGPVLEPLAAQDVALEAQAVDAREFDEVVVAGSDMNGVLRGKRIPGERFARDPAAGVQMSDYIFAMDVAECVIAGEPADGTYWPMASTGFRDAIAVPDLSTMRRVPWLTNSALVLSDFQFRDGTPIAISPRAVLRALLARAARLGYVVKIGAELEFFLYKETARTLRAKGFTDLEPLHEPAQAYGVLAGNAQAEALNALRSDLEAFGVPVEAAAVEAGAGQYELNVPFSEALESADRTVLLKLAIKEYALRHGLVATSMALPPGTAVGNSLHLHLSLWRNERTVMVDPSDDDGLSSTTRNVIGGVLSTFRDFAVLFAPTENSYKRYQPQTGAGGVCAWGFENWTTAVRVVGQGTPACRVEHRAPGGDANPYLAIAGVLAGALRGVEQDLHAPSPVAGDASAQDLPTMPATLAQATDAFEQSAVARAMLGEEFVSFFARTRRWEIDQARIAVTPWEVERYLQVL